MDAVKDSIMLKSKIWAWANSVDGIQDSWNIDVPAKATPRQGAELLHAANILMIMPPSEAGASASAGLDNIIWSITAKDRFDFSETIDAVKALARKYPNIKGVIIDDLTSQEIGKGMTPEDLAKVRDQVKSGDVPLELWGVLYSMNFSISNIKEYMSLLDGVTFWTWESKDLVNLEADFKKAEEIVQGKPMMLGIYMYDFGGIQEIPIDLMENQCKIALRWLQKGRVQGIIMLGNPSLPYAAVQYANDWTGRISQLEG